MKKISILLIAFTLYGCPGNSITAHKWKQNHLEYYLNAEANYLSEIVVRETFDTWDEKTHFSFVYKGRNFAGLKRDSKNTVSFLLKWPDHIPMKHVAWCQRWYNRKGDIVEADIILNMQAVKFTTMRTNKPDSYYIEGVLAHEIGHMIGLEHFNDPSSIMKKNSPSTESFFKGIIDEHTILKYKELYVERPPVP